MWKLILSQVVFFGVGLSCWATPGLALPRLTLSPVVIEEVAGSVVRLRLRMPCGSRYYGLIANVQGDVLRIAAAIEQEPLVCMTLPEQLWVEADYLATSQFRRVLAMPVNPGVRLTLAPIEELHPSAGRAKVEAVYTPRCGRSLGLLIHAAGEQRLELGFVEQMPQRQRASACLRPPVLRPIVAVEPAAHRVLAVLRDHAQHLGRLYSLVLAPVTAASVGSGNAGLALTYLRACNEAPVGLVLGGVRRSAGAPARLPVGMLVARYPNVRCAGSDGSDDSTTLTPVAARYEEAALKLPPGMKPELLASTSGSLQLTVPNHLVLSPAAVSQNLSVQYFGDCRPALLVYGRDRHGMLSVGVLRSATRSSASTCKKSLAEVSLAQPFVAASVQARELYPMRLKGL